MGDNENSDSRWGAGKQLWGVSKNPRDWHFLRWVFPKIVVPPNHHILNRVFHYKPSILGYPYFRKHPYDVFFPKESSLVGYLFCNKFPGRYMLCLMIFVRGVSWWYFFRANHQGFVHWSTEKEGCALQKTKVCLWSVRVACPVPLECWLGSMVRSGLLTVIYDLYYDLYWWFIQAYVISFHCR